MTHSIEFLSLQIWKLKIEIDEDWKKVVND